METLVASVLIVVVFMLSSMVLNNIFSNVINGKTRDIEVFITEQEYLYQNGLLKLPFQDDFKEWHVSIIKEDKQNQVFIEAIHTQTQKGINRILNSND
ncbi:hypothetical protein NO995_07470 [Aestuariibaculum sp. M13]|uniref:hypothetical protein n=1 Tax=unclassified Aestuariibaculum TaxID=2646735 RepID=UPI00215A0C1C|nr:MULTISPECIES: hypothetical protein [unclassified Aestuariibaculum]MCR8667514.1 hypothetical protein [Aestuariibaculum sp. M13]WMI65250.1 hypothetical protein RBH94_14435 [Aestuariibaculum sp. YM273]